MLAKNQKIILLHPLPPVEVPELSSCTSRDSGNPPWAAACVCARGHRRQLGGNPQSQGVCVVCRLVRKLVFMPEDAPVREHSLFHTKNSISRSRHEGGLVPGTENPMSRGLDSSGDLQDDGDGAGPSSADGLDAEGLGHVPPVLRRSASFSDYESQAHGCVLPRQGCTASTFNADICMWHRRLSCSKPLQTAASLSQSRTSWGRGCGLRRPSRTASSGCSIMQSRHHSFLRSTLCAVDTIYDSGEIGICDCMKLVDNSLSPRPFGSSWQAGPFQHVVSLHHTPASYLRSH